MLKVPKLTTTAEIYERTKLPLLENRRRWHTANEMHKIYYNKAPANLVNIFVKTRDIHDRQTIPAASDDYYLAGYKLDYAKCNFAYRGAVVW